MTAFSPTPTGLPLLTPNSIINFPTGIPTSMPTTRPTPFNMYFNEDSQLMFGISIASCLGALSIMIIYAVSPDLRKKTYIQILFWSSLSDFFGAVATSLGYLEDGTDICIAQGIASNIFPLARVFWTVVITYLMYTIIVLSKPMTLTFPIHIVVWCLSTLPTLLVFTTNRIGTNGRPDWCFVSTLSLLTMAGLLTLITIHFARAKKETTIQSANSKLANVNKLWVYPAIIFFCWLTPAIVDTQLAIVDGEVEPYPLEDYVTYLTLALPLSQGFLTAVVFFASTPVLRQKIVHAFRTSVARLDKESSLKYLGSAISSRKARSFVHIQIHPKLHVVNEMELKV
eukprot:gene14747-31337_t